MEEVNGADQCDDYVRKSADAVLSGNKGKPVQPQLVGSEQVKTKSEEETQVETQQDTTPPQTEAVQAVTEVLEEKIQTEVQTVHRQESAISENSTESETTTEKVTELSEETEVEKEAESDAETEEGNGITEAFMEENTGVQAEMPTVLVPDSELRYQELSDGIKEELVIYGYRGGHAVSYEMDFGGLIPVREGNAFHLQDTDGDVCASISAPYLYDASGSKRYDVDTAMVQVSGNRWKSDLYAFRSVAVRCSKAVAGHA